MGHFLFNAYHPIIPVHWTIDGTELEQFKEAGFRQDYDRQRELYQKWCGENAPRPKVIKPKEEPAKAAPRRRVYGMT